MRQSVFWVQSCMRVHFLLERAVEGVLSVQELWLENTDAALEGDRIFGCDFGTGVRQVVGEEVRDTAIALR